MGSQDHRTLAALVESVDGDRDVSACLGDVRDAISDSPVADVVELASQRVWMLLGDEGARRTLLERDELQDRERACLELAEQFALDVAAVTDGQVRACAEHLGEADLYGFVAALYFEELSERVRMALAAVLGPDS